MCSPLERCLGSVTTLVTGATGFVASNIVKALVQRGHEVVAYDIVAPSDLLKRYVAPWGDRITFVQGDILDVDALDRVFASFPINKVIHAAAYTGGGDADTRRMIQINVIGTINVLDLAREKGVDRFLYVSSRAVYLGLKSTEPKNEDKLGSPDNLYGLSKVVCESIVERYHDIHDMDTVSVRLGGPYGPMEQPNEYRGSTSPLFTWTGKALRGEPIELQPMLVADIYVMDVANGLCTVLDAPSLPHRVYNLARATGTSTKEMVDAFLEVCPDAKFVGPIPEDPELIEIMEVMRMDVSRIKDDLGVEATTDPVTGLNAYFQWRRENDFTE